MKRLYKKSLIISAFALALFLCFVMKFNVKAENVSNVTYIDADGEEKTLESCRVLDKDCVNLEEQAEGLVAIYEDGFYFINETTLRDFGKYGTIYPDGVKKIKINQGNVSFILADGVTLKLSNLFLKENGTSLTVYAQSTGDDRGKLEVYSSNGAAIGCMPDSGHPSDLSFTVNGGTVIANSNSDAIDLSDLGDGGTLTVNGGTLVAWTDADSDCAVIAKSAVLNGGKVYANRPYDGTEAADGKGFQLSDKLYLNMTDPLNDVLYMNAFGNYPTVALKPGYVWIYETSKCVVDDVNLRFIDDSTSPDYYNQPIVPSKASVQKHSLTLGGAIGVNFYTYFPGGDVTTYSDYSMNFSIAPSGRTLTVPVNEGVLDSGSGLYRFSFHVKSTEMADVITATIRDGEGNEISTDTYTVEAYYVDVVKNQRFLPPEEKEIRNLIEAVDAYGYYAQQFLSKNARVPWTIGEKHAAMGQDGYIKTLDSAVIDADVEELKNDSYKAVITKDGQVQDINYTLVMEDNTTLKFYVTVEEGGSITAARGSEVLSCTRSGSRYVVLLENIAAHELGDVYTVTLTDANGVDSTITLSALSYANALLGSDTYGAKEEVKGSMAAMYEYYKAAVAYKNKYGN